MSYDKAWNALHEYPNDDLTARECLGPAVLAEKLRSFRARGTERSRGYEFETEATQCLFLLQADNAAAIYPEKPTFSFGAPQDPDQGLKLEALLNFPRDASHVDIHRLSAEEDGFFAYQPWRNELTIYRYGRGGWRAGTSRRYPGFLHTVEKVRVEDFAGNLEWHQVVSGQFYEEGVGSFLFYRRGDHTPKGLLNHVILDGNTPRTVSSIETEPDWEHIFPFGENYAFFSRDGGREIQIIRISDFAVIGGELDVGPGYAFFNLIAPRTYDLGLIEAVETYSGGLVPELPSDGPDQKFPFA
ncbi:hypothetical protein AADZ90_022350 [Aestuariibius sp. 2305UL40-4]|uniref:hypothetical protein n=1 Tax=Aestuariibius violaceus TaxID=3234132 RepID=UPI00345EB7CD